MNPSSRKKINGKRRWFSTKRHRDARPRQLKTLLKLGWQRIGQFWLSPYSGCRYDEGTAVTVESLRGTFAKEYRRTAHARWNAKHAKAAH